MASARPTAHAVRAALGVWLDPVTAWALAAAVAGVVVALAAAALVRPIPVMALLRRGWSVVATAPRNRLERVLRAVAVIARGRRDGRCGRAPS